MKSALAVKESTSILVVEAVVPIRMMMTETLRSLGFKQIQTVPAVKDALSILETEKIDWLIMPLAANEEVNALQILKLIITQPTLRRTQTSLLVDLDSEGFSLGDALELGLLSWHRKTSIKESLQNNFEELLNVLEISDWDSTLAAAEYVRSYLTEKKWLKSRIALEKNLLSLYPGMPKLLISMAEAEYLNQNKGRADSLLSQAELIDENLKPHCQRLRAKHAAGDQTPDVDESKDSRENVLGIKTVVVIDPDSDVLRGIDDMLKNIGVKSVECFENGVQAYAWLEKNPEPDLIIMEWRIPGLPGPSLVQKLRQSISSQAPIVVISSLVKKAEKPLLREMGVDDLLEKPFDHSAFFSTAIWTIQQNRTPTEQKSMERKIRRLLSTTTQAKPSSSTKPASHVEAQALIAKFLADEHIPEASKREMEAEYEFFQGNFQQALSLGAQAIKTGGGDSLLLLNLAGKCMLKLKQHQGALRCFEKANEISSMNIERLLNMAEANLHIEKPETADIILESAESIDPNSQPVVEIKAASALHQGQTERATKLIEDLDSVMRVAGYINNRAVALILSGRFEEGLELYNRALQALPMSCSEARASVTYNLGLAHGRSGEYEEAQIALKRILCDKNASVYKKALALSKRLQLCIDKGIPLFTNEVKNPEVESLEDAAEAQKNSTPTRWDEVMTKIEAKRGDVGCYLVFVSADPKDPKAEALYATPLPYTVRTVQKKMATEVSQQST